jgi:hypothetical protein
MPNTPRIVTRSETTSSNTTENLNKGSKLTFAEMDSNFLELKNGSLGIVGDDSTGIDLAHGSTLKVAGTGGIATSVSGDTLTIDASSITTSSLGDLTAVGSTLQSPSNADITLEPGGTGAVNMGAIRIRDNHIEGTRSNDDIIVDPNGTGSILLNPAASTYGQVVIRGGGDDGGTIHPQLKIVDEEGTELLFGNSWSHASRGSTLASGSGDQLHIQGGNGTEAINLYASSVSVNSDLTITGSLNTDGIEIKDNHIKASRSNDHLILETNNTGNIKLEANIQAGPDAASGLNNTTITGGNNQSVSLIGGSTGGTVKVMPGAGNGTGEKGDIYLTPGSSTAGVIVGDGSNSATISSNSTQDLKLTTNDGGTEPHIQLQDGANGNIAITPHQGGTGQVIIGNQATVSTGDSGGGRVDVAGITFREPGGLAGAGRHTFNAIEIPFSADGSTSSDLYIRLDSNADPFITFNNASDINNGAKIKVNSGSLLLSTEGSDSTQGNIRLQAAGDITLAPSGNLNLGSDTIVVSGNKMFTDSSNEDFELLANGTGNISLLSPANMNSNKIVNVTDPTANQDAATKAYVDTQVASAGGTGDLSIIGSTISAPSNADLTLTTSGTGDIVLSDNVDASGSTITADDFIGDLNGTIRFEGINRSGGTISKGQVVYISGISGNTPEIGLARANSSSTMPGFGLAQADINDNATGEIATFGSLTGLDVADFGETGITFGLGDTLYISSAEAGKLTNVPPTGESNFIQNIGKIERVAPSTNMTIKVGGAGRSNATPALDEGNIFIGNASNQSVTTNLQTQVEAYSINNVVEDTTPQLGGDLDVNGNAIKGSTVSILGATGELMITATENGPVALRYDNNLKLTTKSDGVDITGELQADSLDIDGNADITGTLNTHTIPGGTGTLALTSDITGTGDITFVGSTMSSPSNANFTIETAGTGKIILTGITFPDTDGTADQILGTNGSGVLSFRDPTAINIDGGVADSVYTSVPTIDGGTA